MVEASADPETREPLAARTNLLLPGLYAWLATVAHPATQRGASVLVQSAAAGAVVALAAAGVLLSRRPSLGRFLGIGGFVGLSALSWLLSGPEIAVEKLEPVRAASGAVGWALFAFGWGAVRPRRIVPEDDPRAIGGEPLPPRGGLRRGSALVFGLGITGAMGPPLIAWWVIRPEQALFAHAAAIACSIALVVASAQIAVSRGTEWRPVTPTKVRVSRAAGALTALVVLLMVGLVVQLLGR